MNESIEKVIEGLRALRPDLSEVVIAEAMRAANSGNFKLLQGLLDGANYESIKRELSITLGAPTN